VENECIDFVFCFDSLVHAEVDVMESYIPQILRKLTPSGTAFIHHSNMAAFSEDMLNTHCRGRSVSAEVMADVVTNSGGRILVQERHNWGDAHLSDCLTLFCRGDHPSASSPVHINNARFMEEAIIIGEMQSRWSLDRTNAERGGDRG
jgi:hypothetical protein